MPNAIVQVRQEDIVSLMKRQDELEKEINKLRDMYAEMKEKHSAAIDRIHNRIDKLEKELSELRFTINEMKRSVDSVQLTVKAVEKHVSEINVKQDIAIVTQDKFIGQLWKAFFALLGVITLASGAVFTMLKLL